MGHSLLPPSLIRSHCSWTGLGDSEAAAIQDRGPKAALINSSGYLGTSTRRQVQSTPQAPPSMPEPHTWLPIAQLSDPPGWIKNTGLSELQRPPTDLVLPGKGYRKYHLLLGREMECKRDACQEMTKRQEEPGPRFALRQTLVSPGLRATLVNSWRRRGRRGRKGEREREGRSPL